MIHIEETIAFAVPRIEPRESPNCLIADFLPSAYLQGAAACCVTNIVFAKLVVTLRDQHPRCLCDSALRVLLSKDDKFRAILKRLIRAVSEYYSCRLDLFDEMVSQSQP